jgi:hypothetical protein
MSLTWNIVRKDIYRLRWALVLWFVALTARGAFSGIQAVLDDEGSYPFARGAWLFETIFCPAIAFGLVMAAQSDDPVADVDAFWITRPISGARLLAAKSVLLALMLALPVVVVAPLWISHGFSPHQLFDAMLGTAGSQAVTMALAVPFAVISPDASRFVVNVLVAGVVIAILWLAYQFFDLSRFVPQSGGISESRVTVVASIWVAAALVMTFVQYLVRRTKLAMMVLASAAVLGFSASAFWPWDITPAISTGRPNLELVSKAADHELEMKCWDFALGSATGGGAIQPEVVAKLSASAGTASGHNGALLRIVEIITNGPPPREIAMSLTESVPHFPQHPLDMFLGPKTAPDDTAFYFLMNPGDGRSLIADVFRPGEAFDCANIRYFRTTLSFDDRKARVHSLPHDFHDWIKGAILVKVLVHRSSGPKTPRL